MLQRSQGKEHAMEFDWDDKKARKNLSKHGIAFSEAATVFGDQFAITFEDPDHSIDENRFLTFGYSGMNRLLAVIHCQRHGKTRLISVRSATKNERKIYEEG